MYKNITIDVYEFKDSDPLCLFPGLAVPTCVVELAGWEAFNQAMHTLSDCAGLRYVVERSNGRAFDIVEYQFKGFFVAFYGRKQPAGHQRP